MNKDLTRGPVMRSMLLFAVPMILGNLLQQCYNVADTLIVSWYLGPNALAAVGSSFTLMTFLTSVLLGLCMGSGAVFSIRFGQRDADGLRESARASFVLIAALTVLLNVLAFLCLDGIRLFLRVSDDAIWALMREYLAVIFCGIAGTFLYNYVSCYLRAIGDSITPLIYLLIATVLNIVLDIVFIMVFKMDVDGAAFATVLSQIISALLCLLHIKIRYPILHIEGKDIKITKRKAKQMLQSGLSMGIMMSLVWFGTIALQSAINTLGTAVIVAHTAARKMTEILFLPLTSLGSAIATFTGQNLGAGKYERIRKSVKTTIFICWVWDICAILICLIAAGMIIHFISSSADSEVLRWGSTYLRIDTLFYFVATPITIIRNSMQGYGDHTTPIISSAIEMAGKMAIAFLLVPLLGYWGIIWAEPIVWFFMLIPLLIKAWNSPVLNARKAKQQEKALV